MRTIIINTGKRIGKDLWNYKLPIVLFAAYYLSVKAIFHAYCPMVLVTGLPCPGCGMTRAILLFFQGEWIRSFQLQPQAVLWIFFGGWCFSWHYLFGKKIKGFTGILVALLLLLIVGYGYRMATSFPSYPPMSYRYQNLLANNLRFYKDFLRIFWNI